MHCTGASPAQLLTLQEASSSQGSSENPSRNSNIKPTSLAQSLLTHAHLLLCRTEPRCQYWLFKAGQQDSSLNGCSVKLAPNKYPPTALKLGTGDYTIWQVGGVVLLQHASSSYPPNVSLGHLHNR